MPEDFDTLLSTIATSAGAAARPRGPEAARRRGATRTLRRRVAVSALSAALVAGGIGTALAVGRSGGGPVPPPPAVSPSSSASTSHQSQGPSPSASPAPSTSSAPGDAAPSLSLQLPAELAKGTANQVGFTVTNPGAARTETVTVDLGAPTVGSPTSTTPQERGIVQRQDGSGGAWVAVPVSYTKAGSGNSAADTATYQLSLPAQATVQEQLRVTPVGVESVDFQVTLADGGSTPVTRSRTLPLATPSLTGTGPASVAPGTTSAEFDFTLSNTTTADYSGVGLYLNAAGSTPNCDFTPFATAQWWDGSSWRTVSLSGQWPKFDTIGLGAGQNVTVRTRLVVPATLASCLKRGEVSLIAANGADNPAGGVVSIPTDPDMTVRGDAPFFSIG
ncbi:hypothetical protein ABUW04_01000 [Streptacidiphilus sp. N1-10]|uniref:Uncharacterized protein n=1 Tax=Streptacidiphilus jeojiensis TaxID=3229225 RepID=A0ABV6XFL6_9ACTN